MLGGKMGTWSWWILLAFIALWDIRKQLTSINSNICRLIELVQDPEEAKRSWRFEAEQRRTDEEFWWKWLWRPLGYGVLGLIIFAVPMLLQTLGLLHGK
jgi:hypothetical protein